jgi:hypothetical protein
MCGNCIFLVKEFHRRGVFNDILREQGLAMYVPAGFPGRSRFLSASLLEQLEDMNVFQHGQAIHVLEFQASITLKATLYSMQPFQG